MEKQKKKQKGITLIALVISIIVMLILAGVSLNMTVGDNGIISQAQAATYMQSCAMLEEFFNQQYVSDFDSEKKDNKVYDLILNHPEWFYIPRIEGYGGLDYIEHDGKSLYFIKKSGLPNDIKSIVKGGEAGDGTFASYLNCIDVYGVTENLEVYYCENGMDSVVGIALENIDDIKDRDVFTTSESGLASVLAPYDSDGDGIISSSEVASITKLEITDNVDLSGVFNLYALNKIVFKNVSNINLSGIENSSKLNYIMFFNSSASSYVPIGKLGNKIKYIYFVNQGNDVINKFGEDLQTYDLTGLQYLGAWGNRNYNYDCNDQSATSRTYYDNGNRNSLSSLYGFSKLSPNTKNAVQYMFIENNSLTSLSDISGFKKLVYLRAWGNLLTNVSGISEMTSLTHLQLARNSFADSATRSATDTTAVAKDALYNITGCTSLKWLDLSVNSGLIWISYLKDLPLQYLYLDSCGNLSKTDVSNLKTKMNSLLGKTIDAAYNKTLLDSSKTTFLDYQNQTISVTEFKDLANCTLLNYLDLANCKVVKEASETLGTDEDTVEELMAKVFTNLKRLNILSIQNFTINLGSGAQKIKDLSFLQLTDSSSTTYGLAKTLYILDLRDSNVVAKGDTTGTTGALSAADNTLSIANTSKLNGLSVLRVLATNTNKFDWSKMQGLVNHLTDGYYPGYGKYWYTRGLICQNMESLKTLENCSSITKLVSFSYLGTVGTSGQTLNLSNCNSLTYISELNWADMYITYPNCIKTLTGACHCHHYAFEAGNVDIDELVLDETSYYYWGRSVKELANSGIHVKKLNINAISSEGSLNVFLNDTTGKCEWLDELCYSFASWQNWQGNQYFYNNIAPLKGSSITGLYCNWTTKEDFNWLDGFENQLTKLQVTNSSIKNVSKLSGFTKLTHLNLTNDAVTDMTTITGLTNLKELYLSNNQISKGVENISNLTALEKLELNGNNLAVDQYVDIASGVVKSDFINKFVTLHTTGHLKVLDLRSTGLKNIKTILNVNPAWGKTGSTDNLRVDS